MPKMKVGSVDEFPSEIKAPMDIGENYGEHFYEINIGVPRNEINLDAKALGSTRISSEQLSELIIWVKNLFMFPRVFLPLKVLC